MILSNLSKAKGLLASALVVLSTTVTVASLVPDPPLLFDNVYCVPATATGRFPVLGDDTCEFDDVCYQIGVGCGGSRDESVDAGYCDLRREPLPILTTCHVRDAGNIQIVVNIQIARLTAKCKETFPGSEVCFCDVRAYDPPLFLAQPVLSCENR